MDHFTATEQRKLDRLYAALGRGDKTQLDAAVRRADRFTPLETRFLTLAHAAQHVEDQAAMWNLFYEWSEQFEPLQEACKTRREVALFGFADACMETAVASVP